MPDRLDRIPGDLEALGRDGLLEALGEAGPVVEVGGRRLVNFCSGDSLGLASDPRTRRAGAEAAERAGAEGGDVAIHRELERRLAELAGAEAALLFPSRRQAHAGVPAALVGPEDAIVADELNHASVADGCRLSGAAVRCYRHGDGEDLGRLLASSAARRKLVVTEAVFGLEGDAAPLHAIAALCRRHGAMLYLDEAHAFGVLGKRGAGLAEEAGLRGEVEVTVGSLGGALGSFGAFAAGSRALVESLAGRNRTLVLAATLPPAACGAALAALDLLAAEPERRGKLASLSTRMRDGLEWLGVPAQRVVGPVFPVVLGEERRALEASRALRERGFLAPAIRAPAVPPGTSRLCVSITAAHSREQVDGFLAALKDVLQEVGFRPGHSPLAGR